MVYKPFYLAVKRYSENFINHIREVRKKEKLSFAQLSKRYNTPSSTIRNWCFNIVDIGTKWDILIHRNTTEREKIKNSEINVVPKLNTLNNAMSKFLAGLLYGCEGAKYPATNRVAFANSNPKLIVAFLKLIKKSFDLDKDKFSVHLQIHSDQNPGELKRKWSQILSIPENQFIKPTITAPRGKKHRNDYIGTCTLKYKDYRIQLKLLGIFQAFLNKITSE